MKIHQSVTEDRVVALCMRRLHTVDNPGLCLSCGEEAEGCEPDAERYTCDSCGQKWVYGSDQILIAGYYHKEEPKQEAASQ